MSLIALLLFESIFGVECKLKAPLFWLLLFGSLEYCDEQVEDLDLDADCMDRFKAVDSDPEWSRDAAGIFSAIVGKVVGIFCSHSSTRFWELYRGGWGAAPRPCKRGLTETTTELEFNFSRGDKTARKQTNLKINFQTNKKKIVKFRHFLNRCNLTIFFIKKEMIHDDFVILHSVWKSFKKSHFDFSSLKISQYRNLQIFGAKIQKPVI